MLSALAGNNSHEAKEGITQRRNVKAQVVGVMAGQVDSDGPDRVFRSPSLPLATRAQVLLNDRPWLIYSYNP